MSMSIAFKKTFPDDPAALARRIADRHFGVGGDGLILICPSQVADARMRMFNADGSEAEMCGNGIRCVAKYVYDHGISTERQAEDRNRRGRADARSGSRRRQGRARARRHGRADSGAGQDSRRSCPAPPTRRAGRRAARRRTSSWRISTAGSKSAASIRG